MRNALFILLLCIPSYCWADNDVKYTAVAANALSGITVIETFPDNMIVGSESKPKVVPVGFVTVVTEAANVTVKVTDSKRNPVAFKAYKSVTNPNSTSYIIYGKDKVWVAIKAIDFDKKIYFDEEPTIDLIPAPTPDPDNPDPPDPDNPEPPAPVPDDEFGIGKKVVTWSKNLPKRKEVSAIYAKYADEILKPTNPSANLVQENLVKERDSVLGTDKTAWTTFLSNLSDDYKVQRTTNNLIDRTDTSNYWKAVSGGLK